MRPGPAVKPIVESRLDAIEDGGPDWSVVAVLLTGTFMAVLDFFIVNVAIPHLQHDLSAPPPKFSLLSRAMRWLTVRR